MRRRHFKKAARKAWKIVQGQRAARLTWRESKALEAFAKAYPRAVVKHWMLVKDPRPRYMTKHKQERRRRTGVYTARNSGIVQTANIVFDVNCAVAIQ